MSRSFIHRSVSGAARSYSLVLPAGFVHVGGSWSPEVALSEVVGQLGLEDDHASDFRRQARPLLETPTTATRTGLRVLDSYALAGTWPGTRISATVTCGVADVPPGADPDHTLMAQAARNGGCITAIAGESAVSWADGGDVVSLPGIPSPVTVLHRRTTLSRIHGLRSHLFIVVATVGGEVRDADDDPDGTITDALSDLLAAIVETIRWRDGDGSTITDRATE
jgi:hypothetical protein